MPDPVEIDVAHVAKLARIALTPEEVARFGAQLGALLASVAKLAELPLDDVPATAAVTPERNVARDDVVAPSLARDVVLAQAPRAQGAFFRVPRILGEG